MLAQDNRQKLEAAAPGQILTNHDMSNYVTFKCGGHADYYSEPSSVETFQQLITTAHRLDLPVFFLGGGSNIVFRDQGFQGLVLSTCKLDHIKLLPDHRLKVGAGLTNQLLTETTMQYSLTGFEWANGLPGSIGGAIFMNARCYGSTMSALVKEISYIDEHGQLATITNEHCQFDYKQSIFQHQPWVIVEAILQLQSGHLEQIVNESQTNYQDRINKHQFDFPSAGCVFKNNYAAGVPTGKLIEECELKNKQIGGAQIFNHHANFIINVENCSATDIEELMDLMKSEVKTKKGIDIEPEIRLIG